MHGHLNIKILEKYSNIELHKIPSSGSQVVAKGRTDGQPDRHDEANSCFSQFGERV
jgi:hypothetical protein